MSAIKTASDFFHAYNEATEDRKRSDLFHQQNAKLRELEALSPQWKEMSVYLRFMEIEEMVRRRRVEYNKQIDAAKTEHVEGMMREAVFEQSYNEEVAAMKRDEIVSELTKGVDGV